MNSKNKSDDSAKAGLSLVADTGGCPVDCLPDLIRQRAYQLYQARRGQPGRELDDWLLAEREIKHHFNL